MASHTLTDPAILAAFAHPDDEQTVSGLLRMYGERGVRTAILCATRGEAGEIADPALATRERLGAVREQEMRRAAAVIGVGDLFFLDYRDSGMAGTAQNGNPQAFVNADPVEAVGKIVRIIRAFKPTILITFDPTGGYGHPDHIAICRWTTEAFNAAGDPSRFPDVGPAFAPRRLFYTSIGRSRLRYFMQFLIEHQIQSVFDGVDIEQMGVPDEMISHELDVSAYVDVKRRSLAEHRTQNDPNSPFARIPEELWDMFRSLEMLALVGGEPMPPNGHKGDLFAGL